MALGKTTVSMPIGMVKSYFFPISSEPASAKAVYGEKLDLGPAVKGYLSITTVTGSVPGDDMVQVEAEFFDSGQLDAETTLDELEINAKIYGHTYTEEGGEVSNADDAAPSGGYAFIQSILRKDKSIIYRATCLHKVQAMQSSEKQEADTRKRGEFSPKNAVVSYKITQDAKRNWRTRKQFATLAEADQFITKFYAPAVGG